MTAGSMTGEISVKVPIITAYVLHGIPPEIMQAGNCPGGYPNFATRALHFCDATYYCSLGQFVHVEQTG